jgi:hypothetical protein
MYRLRIKVMIQRIALRGTKQCIGSVLDVPHENLLEDFKAKIWREDIFKPTTGNEFT